MGKFKEKVWLDEKFPYSRTYYTYIPDNATNPLLDEITLGIVMDFNIGLEDFEEILCFGRTSLLGRQCSGFSNEDLPSAYLGFVAYKNDWNLKQTVSKLVEDVEHDAEGTDTFPAGIAERFFDAQNHCFTPKILDDLTNQFTNLSWPVDIVYQSIGPGEYWGRHPGDLLPPVPTPSP